MAYAGATFGTASRGGLSAGLLARGPGNIGSLGITGFLIFDAGKECGHEDPLARFYGEEIQALDWLRDYVMDDDLSSLGHDFDELFRVEEDLEEMYNKADLTTTEADANWADAN